MSYKERLTTLERLLRVDKLAKKYNMRTRSSSLAQKPMSSPDKAEEHDNKVSEEQNENDVVEAIVVEEAGNISDDASIDLAELKKLVFHGLPGDTCYRALVWRLLLNYLPHDSLDKWDEFLAKKRRNYNHFVDDLLILNENATGSDHPLNPEPDSKWQTFFKDNDVLLQIDKDVRRLCPEISFFQAQTRHPNEHVVSGRMDRLHKRVQSCVLESSNVIRKGLGVTKQMGKDGPQQQTTTRSSCETPPGRTQSLDDEDQAEYHWEVIERILFIYAKLNPGQSYVQGMNEIIGPIYYTLANDPIVSWRVHAEADTFYLFTNLMGEIRDFFIRSLDNSVSGIKRMMEVLMDRLESRDALAHQRLVAQEIHPQYYAFRWITLLMSQEFPLPEVLRIWDSLLSDPRRFDFLIDLATAMIIHVRSDLLTGDFPSNMKLLQNYPPIDVRDILSLANSFNASS